MKLRIVHRPWAARPFVLQEQHGLSWLDIGPGFTNEQEARDAVTQRQSEKVIEEFEL